MDASNLLLVFIVLSIVVIILALLVSDRVKANINLPGKGIFSLEADRSSFKPKKKFRFRSKKRKSNNLPSIRLETSNGSWKRNLGGYKKVYLGTDAQNTVQLRPTSGADKFQTCIYWNGSRYRIRNLSRKVPTFVNGKPIREQNLGNGNKIQIGNTVLIFKQD